MSQLCCVVLLVMQKMRFHVLEQKYLELLDDGRHMDGLNCLRNQISALKYNTKRVHKLSSYVLLTGMNLF